MFTHSIMHISTYHGVYFYVCVFQYNTLAVSQVQVSHAKHFLHYQVYITVLSIDSPFLAILLFSRTSMYSYTHIAVNSVIQLFAERITSLIHAHLSFCDGNL